VKRPGRCLDCARRLATAGQGTQRLFCDDVCRQRYKRAQRTAELARLRKLAGQKR
jgi:hypothetical protein